MTTRHVQSIAHVPHIYHPLAQITYVLGVHHGYTSIHMRLHFCFQKASECLTKCRVEKLAFLPQKALDCHHVCKRIRHVPHIYHSLVQITHVFGRAATFLSTYPQGVGGNYPRGLWRVGRAGIWSKWLLRGYRQNVIFLHINLLGCLFKMLYSFELITKYWDICTYFLYGF